MQRLITRTFTLLALALVPMAALQCHPRAAAPAAQGTAAPRVALGGTSWTLVQFQSMDDTVLKPDATATYSLTFDKDGRLRVQADCNRGQGTWLSSDNVSLELGPIALTRAMCRPSPLQDRFVRDLAYVRSYVMRDGNLHLSLMADGGIYEFKPLEPALVQ